MRGEGGGGVCCCLLPCTTAMSRLMRRVATHPSPSVWMLPPSSTMELCSRCIFNDVSMVSASSASHSLSAYCAPLQPAESKHWVESMHDSHAKSHAPPNGKQVASYQYMAEMQTHISCVIRGRLQDSIRSHASRRALGCISLYLKGNCLSAKWAQRECL